MIRAPLLSLLLAATALAGCFGGGDDAYAPGEGWEPTGRTIHIRMWVADLLAQEIYPGFEANLWAFCAEAFDPNDDASAAAIQHWAPSEVDGALGVNAGKCSVPGPTIRVQQGDRVIVEFTNSHFHCHTIHWHGQHVDWEDDGAPGVTQDSVCPPDPTQPGRSNTFKYDFMAKRAGTLWYHCHVDTQLHVMQGLYGVIIVEPQDRSHEPDVDREYVLVLGTLTRDLVEAVPGKGPHDDHQHNPGDCGASGVPGCQNPPVDVTPDTWLINGRSYPHTMHHTGEAIPLDSGAAFMPQTQIWLREGERVRLRLVNVGETMETMHSHGHDMYVTHRDGNPRPPAGREWVDTLTIGPAERYDVVLVGNNPGTWMFHTHINGHETNDGQAPGGMHTMIVYEGWEDKLHSFAAEAPGGQPYTPPPTFPADLVVGDVRDVGTSLEVEETFDFDITMPCAVKRIHVTVRPESGSSATQTFNDLQMVVTGATGETLGQSDIGNGRSGNYTYAPSNGTAPLTTGTHTVLVNGTAVDTRLTFSVIVDYYDSVDEAAAAGACGLSHKH